MTFSFSQLKPVRILFLILTFGINWVIFPSAIPAATLYHPRPASRLHWGPCTGGLPETDCTILRVPLDYQHPARGTIRISAARLKATNPQERIGTLFINPGGPGGSGERFLASFDIEYFHRLLLKIKNKAARLTAEGWIKDLTGLREHFDIIGFEPRGLGRGDTLQCNVHIPAPHFTYPPSNKTDFNQLTTYNHAYGLVCEHQAGALMGLVDTPSVVQDIDSLRRALNEKMISYYGASYGTVIGQLYAEKYPTHLRAMVLDGNLDHSLDMWDEIKGDATSEEDALKYYDQHCKTDPSCTLPGKNIISNLDKFLRATEAGKIITKTGKRILPENIIRRIEYALEYSQSGIYNILKPIFALQPAALDKLAHYSPYTEFEGKDAFYELSVDCQDLISHTPSWEKYHQELQEIKSLAPHMYRSDNLLNMTIGCYRWPIPPRDPPQPLYISYDLPVLILGNHIDPATPLPGTLALHQEIHNSRLITTDLVTHCAFMNSHCATVAVVRYLLTAQLPQQNAHCSG